MNGKCDRDLDGLCTDEGCPNHRDECVYCGQSCDGKWCSRECRRADEDDSQHQGED